MPYIKLKAVLENSEGSFDKLDWKNICRILDLSSMIKFILIDF